MIAIGIVVPRYGKGVAGAAETLARNVAERLQCHGFRVTVFTTCASDLFPWRDEHPAGESLLKGVRLRRFPVDGHGAAGGSGETNGDSAAGPFSPGLVQGLIAGQEHIDLFIFFSCRGYAALEGIRAVSKPVILFPVLSAEQPGRLAAMADIWRRPGAIFFLTGTEMDLARRQFDPPGKMRLVRVGVDIAPVVAEKPFRRRFRLSAPYLLYVGRIEAGRGLEAVFDHYLALKREAYVDLVLIGRKRMGLPAIQGLKYLGFVSADDKLAALKGAVFSVQPSPRGSLSLATLESFSVRTPALVNRRCPVLREHVEASGGGLAYDGEEEFLAGFRQLYNRPALRQRMGEKGLEYVKRFYSWAAVMREIEAGIAELLEIKF